MPFSEAHRVCDWKIQQAMTNNDLPKLTELPTRKMCFVNFESVRKKRNSPTPRQRKPIYMYMYEGTSQDRGSADPVGHSGSLLKKFDVCDDVDHCYTYSTTVLVDLKRASEGLIPRSSTRAKFSTAPFGLIFLVLNCVDFYRVIL
jgi:hypothetical protein